MKKTVDKFRYRYGIVSFFGIVLVSLFSFLFAANGNVDYTYDELRRLKTATYPDGTVITYIYDQTGNRTSMQVNGVVPSIQVTEPNGGEIWTLGTTQNIQWSSDNVNGNINISLSRDNGVSWVTLAADSPNDGIEQWEVIGEVSDQCLIRVASAADPNIDDTSDAPFSIIPGESTITLLSPNGGEILVVNSQHAITWQSDPTVGDVMIEYSTDNGSSWNIIDPAAPNNGQYPWNILEPISTQCLVKISETDGSPSDISDAVFSIVYPASVSVISPNGGEVWEAGTNQTISWDASGNISQVDVSILRPGDTAVFSQTFFSNPGSTTWDIPTDMSGIFFARVRITDGIGNQYEDNSNEYFNVVDPSTVDDPFAAPEVISNLSQTLGEVDMAVDPANNLHAAWSDNFNLFYRRKTTAGWGTIDQLTTNSQVKTNGENHVLIDVGTDNRSHIIYKFTNNDLYYTYDNGVNFTSPVNITNSGNVVWYRMAMDTNNNLHLIFRDTSYQVHYRKITGGSIDNSASTTLWTTCGDSVGIAVASPAEVYAFRGCDGISYRKLDNGTWGDSQTLTTTPGDGYPGAEVDSSGTVHLTWKNTSGLWYAELNNQGVFSTPTLISTFLGRPKLTLDKNNFPVVSNPMSIADNIHMTIIKKTNSGWINKIVSTNSQSANDPGPVAVDSSNIIHVLYTGWNAGSMVVFYTNGNACGIDTFIISGTVSSGGTGVENVVMNGLPGNPTTDSQGYYTAIVNCGWSGVVTPVLTGYTFTEASTTYTNVTSNQTTNYTAALSSLTISGTVTSGGIGLENVVMNGLPGNPTTDSQGFYTGQVNYGWTGTVTPTLAGYIFTESSTAYTNVTANQTTNYTATLLVYTISGIVTSEGAGLANVLMSGLPGNPVTDSSGFYTAAVSYGWNGTVTPILAGYTFTEPSTTYTDVTSHQTMNYTATLIPTITVISPNGGETWEVGSTYPITWTNTGTINNITIEYSTNNGGVWAVIVQSTANTNIYNWTVPDELSDLCLVRISDDSSSAVDLSDAPFSIVSPPPPALRVTYPNAGERFTVGSMAVITWASNGNIREVRLEYSTDNGQTWMIIVPATANDGSYQWTMPDTPSESCLVRISESDKDQGVFDISDGGFSIDPGPFITVTSPDGGETWEAGSSHPITWTSKELTGNVKIEYSTSGGNPWTTITAATANTGSFNWTVPNNLSGNCLIRVSETDGVPTDMSDRVFSIVSPSSLTVISPNGSESWAAGSNHVITWASAGEVENVNIEYSADFGGHWITIVSSTGNDDSYEWKVADNPSDSCLVRITESNTDSAASDVSDARFSITPAPVITIASPNGGEKLKAGTTHNITWTSSQVQEEVKIEYSTDNGTNWASILLSTGNTGTYNWTVPDNPSKDCIIRISETDGEPADVSDRVFSIESPSTATITVTSPNGGESLTAGAVHPVTWTSTGMEANDGLIIEYSTDGGGSWTVIEPSALNSGSYEWSIPENPSQDCLVRISGNDSDEGPSDVSDGVFSIIRDSVITVISPNGGESLTAGSTHEITWTGAGIAEGNDISIQYSIDSGVTWKDIIPHTANSGNYTWTIPDDSSEHCLIRVKGSDEDEGPSDQSDAVFSIVSSDSITIVSPNGGEQWETGSSYDITWTFTGITGNIVIDLYQGDAFDFNIGTVPVDTGKFTWQMPENFTTGEDYRVFLHKDTIEDYSDAVFSITDQDPNHPDFNNDGKVDILWRNYASGMNEVWYMNGAVKAVIGNLPAMTDLNWRISGTGDFNRDGKVDILWRHYTTGQNLVWYMDGVVLTGSVNLPVQPDVNWRIVGTGDFNRDGKDDILWRNVLEGRNQVWFMDGVIVEKYQGIQSLEGQEWRVVGVGDFNSDGKVDILWRNYSTGSNEVWYMDGGNRIGTGELLEMADMSWQVVGTGDFNLDREVDILWRNNSDGREMVWYMDGVTRVGFEYIETRSDLNWRIVSNGDTKE